MSPQLTDNVDGVLRSLLKLYGTGQPAGNSPAAIAAIVPGLTGHAGAVVNNYSDTHSMQLSVAETHAGKDSAVGKTVSASGEGTLNGRNQLTNQIADLRARVQAVAAFRDMRFSGSALLDAAHATITDATRQVDADIAAARRHAAQIGPPAIPRAVSSRASLPNRRRRRSRVRSSGRSIYRPRRPVPSDGTAGGKAVSAASGWLGTPYIWGGGGAGGPSGGGFDCSGLTQYAIAQATDGRVVLPRTTYEQIYSGVRVSPHDVRPGDLVFPASSFSARGPEHVQLAAGNGMVIEAPYSGSTVKVSPMPSRAVIVRVM
ncbi:C40 family peptidase [Nocardia sp. CA2R105]|uniref:C40 family peptidase n=1 Tax=Nocardia coffeae TaxID=2873381 RepID=UPI001CA711ED|nr:C40 family peptidase [Nocardia coffeae]MBY8862751.1 C40 family peptidase [Nocardia coffeae]